MNASPTETATAGAEMSGSSLQALQSQTLDKVMDERQLSAKKLAGMIETDEFEVDMIAMQIADARAGEGTLPQDVCGKIAHALHLDITAFYHEHVAATPVAQDTDTQRNAENPVPTTDRKKSEVRAQRRANVRKLMQEQGKKPGDIVSNLGLDDKERKSTLQLLYNIKSDTDSASVSVEKAHILARAFGVDPMIILGSLTDSELKKSQVVGTPSAVSKHTPIVQQTEESSEEDTHSAIHPNEAGQETAEKTDHVLGVIELTGRKMSELFDGKAKVVRSGPGYKVVATAKISQDELIQYLSKGITREKLVELLLQQHSK